MNPAELRAALVRLKWQQKDLAERLKVDPDTVSRWALGRVPVPGYAEEYLRVVLLAKEALNATERP